MRFIESELNRCIGESTAARELLARLNGTSFAVHVEGLGLTAVLHADGELLLPGHLPLDAMRSKTEPYEAETALLTLSELERRHIKRVLAESGGQMNVAAEILGIHRNTLRRKLIEYGIAQ